MKAKICRKKIFFPKNSEILTRKMEKKSKGELYMKNE